jgi:PAS domain S-box-containing protein
LAHATQLEALLAVPLFARDQVIGLVVVGHAQPHKWLPREVNLLQTIADQVANSIDSARLFQSVVAEQRKVQAIFDSGLSGLYATDADGQIVMFNRAAERMTGWSFDEVRNKKWEDVLRDPTASDRESLIYEALHHGKSAFAYEGQHIRTRDGRIIEAAKAVAPLLDETNQVIGAVGAFWDRSRELVAEYEREEFLQTAAHQLRTPLTSLLLSLDLLQRKNISAKRRAEMMKIARFDGERLKRLADQLLDWRQLVENKSTIRLEPVSIIAATRTLVQESEMTDQAKHRFQVDAPKPEPLVDANLDAVEHIMRNLIDNAINYSPAASMIRVAFTLGPMDRIDISVSDEGPGIPFEEQEKIFQPFYRSESAGKHRQYGHGLGLAIAQRFAKQMDSEIHVESQPGRGSKFYFTLRRHV